MKRTKKVCAGLLATILLVASMYIPQTGLGVVNAEEQSSGLYKYSKVEKIVEPVASSYTQVSEWGDYGPFAAFDNNSNTKWHTYYSNGNHDSDQNLPEGYNVYRSEVGQVPSTYADVITMVGENKLPIFIGGKFEERVLLGKFSYVGRNGSADTWFKQYALYVADVTEETVTDADYKLVKTGNITANNTSTPVEIELNTPVNATHFKLVAFTTSNGTDNASAVELEMYEAVPISAEVVYTSTYSLYDHPNTADEDESNPSYVTDQNLSSQFIMIPQDSKTCVGDYFGLVFAEAVSIKNIQFVFDSTALQDTFVKSKLQYLPATSTGQTEAEWQDVIVNGRVLEFESDQEASVQASMPSELSVRGLRLYCTENSERSMWLRINEIVLNQEENTSLYDTTDVPRFNIIDATAGSEYSSNAVGDGPANYAIDGNSGTWWHTNWYDGNHTSALNLFWIDLEFNSLTMIDGVRTLPRGLYGGKPCNGVIAEYEVWVSAKKDVRAQSGKDDVAWKNDYVKVCSGTWDPTTGNGSNVWKTAKFEPTLAKHVRVLVTASGGDNYSVAEDGVVTYDNRFASLPELRVTQASNNTKLVAFKGGSLRMNDFGEDYTKTSMRLGYDIPKTVEEWKNPTWKWMWGKSASSMTTKVEGINSFDSPEMINGLRSNLVITGIPKEQGFATDVHAQLIVTYVNDANESLTLYEAVENRSVNTVANAIVANYEKDVAANQGNEEKLADLARALEYAKGILGN